MKNNNIETTKLLERIDTKVFFMIVGLMLFSMYFPYNHNIAIVYQVMALILGVWCCKKNSCGIAFVLILNVTREYIAISTMDSFSAYYSLNSSVMIIYILLLVGIKLYQKKGIIKFDMAQMLLVALGIQMFMSEFGVMNSDEYNTYFPVVCFIYILGTLMVEEKSSNFTVKIAFLLSGLFMAIGIIPYYISHSSIQELTALINENGLLVDRNYQSLFLMLCILNSVVLLIEYAQEINIFFKTGIVAIIVADIFIIVVGASRSAILGLIMAIILYIVLNVKSISRNIIFLGAICILFIFAYNTGLLEPILKRFAQGDVSSGNGRFTLWTQYLANFKQGNLVQVIFGRGLIGKSIVGAPAHNLFVSILFSFGVLGETIFLLYCVCIIIKVLKLCKLELIIIIPILFMCCTLEPYYRIEFALYIACIPAMLVKKEKRENERTKYI